MFFRGRSKYNWKEIFIQYGSRLASLTHHEGIYKSLLSTFVEISGASSASILLFDADLQEYSLKEKSGLAPLSFSIPAHHPLILWLERDAHPLMKHQLTEDLRLIDLKIPALTYFSEWHVEIAFPILADQKFLGILNLGERPSKAYDTEDLELFSNLMVLTSHLIENACLYETLLKQNFKLSELARLKTQFVSNITHELRTPLHGILGLTEILLEDTQTCLPEDYRRYLEMMKNSGQSLLESVDHILNLTRYQSGLVQLDIKKLDLKKMVDETSKELSDHFLQKKCELVLDWPDGVPHIYGDEAELKHLVLDLLGNAIKFTEEGNIRVSASKAGEMIKVCIQDTGLGIDEKEQSEIFEEFYQSDASMTRAFGGTGLGLALAKKIVELHGGRIWVESKKGMGSHFYFTLPLHPSYFEMKK